MSDEEQIRRNQEEISEAVARSQEKHYNQRQAITGERLAADALAANGHVIIYAPTETKEASQSGFDIVTMKKDDSGKNVLYMIDNKAFTTGNDVGRVSALEENREKNIEKLREYLAEYEAKAENDHQRGVLQEASRLLDRKEDQCFAVTNAAVAKDEKLSKDVSDRLKEKNIEFLDIHNLAEDRETVESNIHVAAGKSPSGQESKTEEKPMNENDPDDRMQKEIDAIRKWRSDRLAEQKERQRQEPNMSPEHGVKDQQKQDKNMSPDR
jgi:hypothetical protein